MENTKLTLHLELHEWIKISLFDLLLNEGLTKIIAVLVKMYCTPLYVNKNANYRAYFKITKFWKIALAIRLKVIIVPPSSACELISSCTIDTPYIDLPRQILV